MKHFLAAAVLMVMPVITLAQEPGAPAEASAACPPLKQLAASRMSRARNGQYWLPAVINGEEKFLMLDTGGVVTSLYVEAAEALKLPVEQTRRQLVDIDGNVSNRSARIASLSLGSLKLDDARDVMILPRRNPRFAQDARAGILALDLLGPYDIDVDFGSGAFNLFSPEHCKGHVVYWNASAVAAIPIRYDSQGKVRVEVRLDGVTLNAMLDTGSATTILNRSIATGPLKVDLAAADVRSLGRGDDMVYFKRFGRLELNGLTVENPMVTIITDRMKNAVTDRPVFRGSMIRERGSEDQRLPDLIIGASILNKLHIYLAGAEKTLYVTPAAAPESGRGG